MEFSTEQQERYARQLILKEIGEIGQEKLVNSRVMIIGAGGLGSPAAMYLAAAGVGEIGIADADRVDLSNLQRQIMHTTADLNREKAISARETLNAINPHVKINAYCEFVDDNTISDLIKGYDFVIDATDNFKSKFLINDACVREKKPFSHGGIMGFNGQLMTYIPEMGPCYRCVFKDPPPEGSIPTGRQAGVIGAVAGTIGSMQAAEAIKYITGAGDLLVGYLLVYDALKMTVRKIKLPEKNKDCAACGS